MRTYSFTIGDIEFNGRTPSATDQVEALRIVGRTSLIASLQEQASDMQLVAACLQVEKNDFDALARVIVGKADKPLVVRAEDDAVGATPTLFADKPEQWYLLVAYAAREVLGSFWTLSRGKDKEAAAQ